MVAQAFLKRTAVGNNFHITPLTFDREKKPLRISLTAFLWRGQKWPRFKLKGRLSNFTVIDYFIAEEEDDEYIRDHQSPPPHWDIFK